MLDVVTHKVRHSWHLNIPMFAYLCYGLLKTYPLYGFLQENDSLRDVLFNTPSLTIKNEMIMYNLRFMIIFSHFEEGIVMTKPS